MKNEDAVSFYMKVLMAAWNKEVYVYAASLEGRKEMKLLQSWEGILAAKCQSENVHRYGKALLNVWVTSP